MGRVRLVRQVGRVGQMGQVDGERILNCELGTSCKLAPAGGMSHTGDYGTCRTGATNGTGRTREIMNFELGTSCKLATAGGNYKNEINVIKYYV